MKRTCDCCCYRGKLREFNAITTRGVCASWFWLSLCRIWWSGYLASHQRRPAPCRASLIIVAMQSAWEESRIVDNAEVEYEEDEEPNDEDDFHLCDQCQWAIEEPNK